MQDVTEVNDVESVNVRELLQDRSTFGPEEIKQLERVIAGDGCADVRDQLRELQTRIAKDAGSPRDSLAAGVTSYLLARHTEAVEQLSRLSGDGLAEFHHALALLSLERLDEAAISFEQAAQHGYDPVHCALCRAGAIRLAGRLDEAEKLLHKTAKEGATRAEYSFQMGCILSDRGDTFGAIEYFERAVDMDPHHSGALFRLAGENSLLGNDDVAIQLYEQSLAIPPLSMGALANLGLLYEDNEQYAAAAFCFRKILNVYPNHPRARLFLKDIEAASNMYYDEDAARLQKELGQVLEISLSDFELTARSRNCLEGAGLHTLGDLTRTTEQELLAGKNFGETSLTEIRSILESRGLSIGQAVTQAASVARIYSPEDLSPQERTLMESPVTELNLSVRARKCLTRLGIMSIGQLLAKSVDELMGVRNFGVTSLNEIRAKLADQDLKLRND